MTRIFGARFLRRQVFLVALALGFIGGFSWAAASTPHIPAYTGIG